MTDEAVKPAYWEEAVRVLSAADPVMARLTAAHADIHLRRRGDPFSTLARAILGQQISVKAAAAIWRRLAVAAGADEAARTLDPARVAALTPARLAAAGLSARKAAYVGDLARHFASGRLDPAAWPALDDEALIGALTEVKGIGRWTAQIFLIFHELRPDVLPLDDLGLRRAIERAYFAGRPRARSTLERLGRRWAPYRSVAAWYLWRSLDAPAP